MFDIAPSELLLVAIVALVVIGPKDLPKVMRVVGQWVGRARGMARHFRSGFDDMVRQAELEEMEKRWAAENARIMAEHPAAPAEEAHDAAYAYGHDVPAADPEPEAPPPTAPDVASHAMTPLAPASPADEVAAAEQRGPARPDHAEEGK